MKRKVFLISPLACASALALAQTLPSGGKITQGSGSVSVSGSSMLVQQDTARMVADWQSFSIGNGASVRFVQPSSSAVALNRVLGSDPSVILGRLSANGHVYLQNAAGVLFAPSAQVDVGALVATSLNVDVRQILAGQLRLAGGAGSGAVHNEGSIAAAPGGHVVLAAPQVSNSGSIAAPLGTAALAVGSAVEIDPTGSGLLSIRVPVSAVGARLEQSGHISADGGSVSLQAAAADAALATLMQVGGVVRARSIEQRDGQIVLSGIGPGIVRVDATLDASGGTGERGGTVKVLGERVGLFDGARIDASGGSGGGTVLVGGNYQGRGPEANAQLAYVAPQASIDASARDVGDGGRVIVWSDRLTSFQGAIAARGGSAGGDGGFVEVSGKERLDFAGAVDLSAANGSRGSLLLDPFTLEIGAVADVNGDATSGDDLVASPLLETDFAGAQSQVTADRVATLLATGDVTLQATDSISVTAPLTVAPGGAASTLSLNALSVAINEPMSLANSALNVDTNQNVSDTINVQAPVQSLSSISLTSSDIFISATLSAPNVTLTARVNDVSALSFIGASNVGSIVADTLVIERHPGAQSSVGLNGPNQLSTLRVTADSASITIVNPTPGPIEASGTVGPGPAFGSDFTLNTNTGVVQDNASPTGALVVSGGFSLTTTDPDPVSGAVRLQHPGNSFAAGPISPAVSFNVASSLELSASGSFDASGTVGSFARMEALGGPFVLNGTIESLGTSAGPAELDLRGVGFQASNGTLVVPTGGRFIIRSSDQNQDFLGVSPGGGPTDINHILLGGWTGAFPLTGNVYVTNTVGSMATPAGDEAGVSKVYDGSTAFAYTQSGGATTGALDTPSSPTPLDLTGYTLTSSGNFADKNVAADKAYTVAPTTNVIATSVSGETYYGLEFAGFARAAGAGTAVSQITPRALTSSGVTAVDRVYDGTTNVALDVSAALLNNVVAGDTVGLAAGAATGNTSDKNVGVGKAVGIDSLTLTGADAGNYSISDASNATVTISPLAISSTGLTAVNRAYNGTTTVAMNTSGGQLRGVFLDDSVGIAAASGTMADKNVGTAKPVTVGSVALTGTDAGNYTVTDTSSATVDIAPATIFLAGVSGVNRAYDGTTIVALDTGAATLSGAVAGDAVGLATGTTGTMSDKNVGTDKPVFSVSGFSLTGADAVNYSLSVGSFPITVDITPRSLAVAGITAQNRIVDGTTSVALNTGAVSLPGVLAGDVVALDASGATGNVSTPDPGVAKTVFVSGLELTGADAANYSLLPTPIGPSGGGLTVRLLSVPQGAFEEVRQREYLQGVSDAQEPFRRAMAEALAAGFGKENIRKQLGRGLVFETGLAAPAVDTIESAARPASCQAAAGLACGR